MQVLNQLFSTLKVSANVFHNGQYCGNWAIDTSGTSYISFHIVSHGRCFLSVDQGKTHCEELNAGDIVLFPRDCAHCLTSDESFSQPINTETSIDYADGLAANGTGLICGYFSHQHPLMEKVTHHLPEYVVVRAEGATALSALVKVLLNESMDQSKGSELVMTKLSETILAILLRDNLATETGLLAAMVHPKIGPTLELMHDKPEHKWTVEELAESRHMSRASFSDLFKQVTGQSPLEYLTQWRLSLAYRMLADENATTLSAALACGYDNESSFSKAFKRVLGVSPGKVRAQVKAQATA